VFKDANENITSKLLSNIFEIGVDIEAKDDKSITYFSADRDSGIVTTKKFRV
jgi:hypothetical protein